MADDDGFITPPPGLLNPDSGTHRRPRPERTERIPNDEIVFVPAAPGVPVPQVEAEPPTDADAVTPLPAAAPPSEPQSTAEIPRAWTLRIPGLAEPVRVDDAAALFLGRAPVAPPTHPSARVIAVPDPEKSVSKTHAMLDSHIGELRVHDLHSTNGTWVVPAGGEAIEVEPGVPMSIPAGAELELGDVVIRVELG